MDTARIKLIVDTWKANRRPFPPHSPVLRLVVMPEEVRVGPPPSDGPFSVDVLEYHLYHYPYPRVICEGIVVERDVMAAAGFYAGKD